MELRQIRTFLSVAETLHFGRSARLINLSQPALGLQIKALEDELGIQLLSRNRQGTGLTEAGQACREDAAIALERLEFAKRKALTKRVTANLELREGLRSISANV